MKGTIERWADATIRRTADTIADVASSIPTDVVDALDERAALLLLVGDAWRHYPTTLAGDLPEPEPVELTPLQAELAPMLGRVVRVRFGDRQITGRLVSLAADHVGLRVDGVARVVAIVARAISSVEDVDP